MTKGNLQRVSWILALPACLLIVAAGLAHPGHEGSLNSLQAVMRAKAVVRSLIEKGEPVEGELLDESWTDIDSRTSCAATSVYYLISLENHSEGKTLYVLLSNRGQFLRARFDAEFTELKDSPNPLIDCDRQ